MSKAKKLTRAEKQQINAAIQNARRQDKRHKSAQDSIPFQRMFPDGICHVTDHYYTKTVQFQDINYQLNQNEDKAAIFDGWCDFLNYFDSSVRFELSFINTAANKDTYSERIAIPLKGDSYDSIRAEYTQMLKNQLAKGNNGLIKTKYLTFGIEADSLKNARLRLERIETDVLNNFKRLGVQADPMNGKQRLELLHGIFHMDEQQPFLFDWDWLAPTGLSVKDFIAPSSFSFRNGKNFTMGRKIGQVSFLQILAPELNDRMLADFLDMQSSLIVTMHVQSVDQVKAIRTIKRKITDLQKMTIEEQKKAVRAGYQLRKDPELAELRFMNSHYLREHGLEPAFDHYEAVYSGSLPSDGSTEARLDDLYMKFNTAHPQDFTGHSLSVSDIVVLRQQGAVSSHYVDSVGFVQLPAFLPDNYLKNAEMSMEDDYGMIDGIINNGPKEQPEVKPKAPDLSALFEAARQVVQEDKQVPEPGKKPSILAMLHAPAPSRSEKTAQTKSAERDLI